jgi:hypothetical protein
LYKLAVDRPLVVLVRQTQLSRAAQVKFAIYKQAIEYGFKQAKDELG